MSRVPPRLVNAYIFGGQIRAHNCVFATVRTAGNTRPVCTPRRQLQTSTARRLHVENNAINRAAGETDAVPLRKQIKEEIKRRKSDKRSHGKAAERESLDDWELTIGIEVHAQLNTAKKLFSSSPTAAETPNTDLSFFDLALPGSQPLFQPETLIPAVRAALALDCEIQHTSTWDRKHYFHWDQPSGYQLTQFYHPFAKDGHIKLYARDGIAAEDGDEVTIGIKQIQMEQDTAKTITTASTDAPGGKTHYLDFNRVGIPLIEIITLPDIHYPSTAAALVKKLQTILNSVDACVLGMEEGGLRADVNVSVRPRSDASLDSLPLGTRTEIKNLNSFKSIRDAIIAERDRQIAVIEAGGQVLGETRGYTIGGTGTTRLRGKEGEVDYRYMPDPDLPPLVIGEELVKHLRDSSGVLPDQELEELIKESGMTTKDAMSLLSMDNGHRIEYYHDVVSALPQSLSEVVGAASDAALPSLDRVSNWVLHELGGLEKRTDAIPLFREDGTCIIPANFLADLINLSSLNKITGASAKVVLIAMYEDAVAIEEGEEESERRSPVDIVEENQLWFEEMKNEEYTELAEATFEERLLKDILGPNKKKAEGKIMYWVGKMMREAEGRCDAVNARKAIERYLKERSD